MVSTMRLLTSKEAKVTLSSILSPSLVFSGADQDVWGVATLFLNCKRRRFEELFWDALSKDATAENWPRSPACLLHPAATASLGS